MTTIQRKGGLLPLPHDERDFNHAVVFGAAPLKDIPEGDFFVGEVLDIKDQGSLDFCAGFATAAVSEDQELIPLNGEFQFMAAKKVTGGDTWRDWGTDLRSVCKGACDFGCLDQEFFSFEGKDRDFLANPANWSDDFFMMAAEHRKNSYFRVDTGPYDTFDNLRSTMYRNRMENRSVLAGVLWRYDWNNAPGGVIPSTGWEESAGEGHAIKVMGWKIIDGQPYLVVQNSWGKDMGDGGFFYFPRKVVNEQFTYGAFTFKDMPKDYAQYLNENGLNEKDNWARKLLVVLKNWVLSLFTKK